MSRITDSSREPGQTDPGIVKSGAVCVCESPLIFTINRCDVHHTQAHNPCGAWPVVV